MMKDEWKGRRFFYSSFIILYSSFPLKVACVKLLVGAIARHHFIDVSLRLIKANFSSEDSRVALLRATYPARYVVLAAVVGSDDRFGQIRKHADQFRYVFRA